MQKLLLALAVLSGLYYTFFFPNIPDTWAVLVKLIPMIILVLVALLSPSSSARYKLFISIGLVFCAIGDYTLQWFIIGLCFFFVGHVFYIIAFLRGTHAVPTSWKIGLLSYGMGMFIWMGGTLLTHGDHILAIAVTAYITIILSMGWTAFRTRIPYAIIGALLFITSDSILAINRFITQLPFAHGLIMLTYYGAQIFIVLSITKYFENRNKMIH